MTDRDNPLTGISAIAITDASGRLQRADNVSLPLYSITKTYIAAAILSLELDLDAPISTWFDEYQMPEGRRISVRQLLNHTSGIRDYGALPAYREAIIRTSQGAADPWTDADFGIHTLQCQLLFEPGSGWTYSNPGYWLLNQIGQRETGLDFEGLLNRQIFEPLGLNGTHVATGLFADDLPGYPADWVWHGLLIGTPGDTVTFMRSAFVTKLLIEPVPVPGPQPGWRAPHYGYGLMIEPGHRYGHNGGGPGYSASCFHFTETDRTLCVLMASGEEDAAMQRLLALEAAPV